MDLAAITADLVPTGTLRAAVNLGNVVLATGPAEHASGVTVDLATEIARRLGVPVELLCFDAARESFQAMADGRADICFLAIEPARLSEVAFTAPYVIIEGVYVVPVDSPLTTPAEVDRSDVRVGVREGSAYDLFLTRTLERATVVRGSDGIEVFREYGLEAGAGIRQPLAEAVADDPSLRLIDEAFMQIRQAVGTTPGRFPETVQWLHDTVEELRANGFVAQSLAAAGQNPALVAPTGA